MQHCVHDLAASDGLRLFVRDVVPEAPRTAIPVLCLHGLTRNSRDFEDVWPWLAAQGRRVLALDVRGRGASQWDPVPQNYHAGTYASDVEAVLTALGVPNAVFIGTSMGGLITMILAARRPDLIAGAVLNDIGPIIDPRGLARISAYVGKTGAFASFDALADHLLAQQGALFPKADRAFWLRFARRCARETAHGEVVFDYDPAIAQTMAQAAAPQPDLMPLFVALAQKPVLAVRGAISDILPAEGLAAMAGAKPGLHTVEVPDVGHAPTLEEPAARDAICAFLQVFP
ncbi:MAG TPA: alpha/beta hydrolase [Alphaproteobacteria bacterium]|nr:alpha/beta hydrolase [Alphaproteobacteria bacterium]